MLVSCADGSCFSRGSIVGVLLDSAVAPGAALPHCVTAAMARGAHRSSENGIGQCNLING